VAAWWTLLGLTAVLLLLRAPYEAGTGPAEAFDTSALGRTLTGRPGLALLARLLVLLLTAAFLIWWSRRRDSVKRPVALAIGTALATALALTWAAAEHASAGIQVPVAMTSSVVHLLATGVWLGGLVALLLTLRRSSGDDLVEVVPRFSRIAFASVTVLAVTGLYQSWRGLGSLSALSGTSYGRLLLAKLAGVAVLLLVARYSRRWTARIAAPAAPARAAVPAPVPQPVGAPAGGHEAAEGPGTGEPGTSGEGESPGEPESPDGPAGPGPGSGDPGIRRRLRRSVLVEVAVAAVVLMITTVLTGTLPSRAEAEAAQQAPVGALPPTTELTVPFDTGADSVTGSGKVQVTLDPARVGENGVQAVVYGSDMGLVAVPEVRITFTLPSREVGPIDAELADRGGYWSTNSVNLPLAGDWTMKTTVRVSDVDQVSVERRVRVEP
jgi:copper transport protein